MLYHDGPLFRILSICKGGGYRYCRTDPPHPKQNAKGLYPLHRVLAENRMGRLLAPGEIVHHDDEDKTNDNIDNLVVETNAEHSRKHARKTGVVTVTCGRCGKVFTLKPCAERQRRARGTTGDLFCSRSCGATARRARGA